MFPVVAHTVAIRWLFESAGLTTARLRKRAVDLLTPGNRPYFVYDEDLTGFGIRVGVSGAKSWFVEYRPGAGGRTAPKRRLTLGSALKLTPDQARREAKDALARVRLGADPALTRSVDRDSVTLAQLIDIFMAQEIDPKRAAGTADLYRIYFAKHVRPSLGTRKAASVTHADVAKLHRDIGRTRKPTANRVVTTLSGLFTFAAKERLIAPGANPARDVAPYKEEARDRYLTPEEFQRLGATLLQAETMGLPYEIDPTKPKARNAPKPENRSEVIPVAVTAAIRLLLFTGCRLREILHLRWADVDVDRGLAFLPTSKTGRKTVVLSAPALAVIGALPRTSAYVVSGRDPKKPRSDLKRPWGRITRHADLHPLRIHDLRHSFASIGAGAGMGLPIVGKLLGHAQPSTTARYAHLDADPLRRAADSIGATISAAMTGTVVRR